MSDLLPQFQQTLQRYHLVSPGSRLVIGVSGGPDSVALLHLFLRLRAAWQLELHVAHLHHGIRGAEADADATFVADLAARWGLPCTIERCDVPALAREERLTLEEAARRQRYAFLARVALRQEARSIAVAHHADDQAETVLMHLLRGSGPAGLRGMAPATPLSAYRLLSLPPAARSGLTLIRPLLFTPRAAIQAYCAEQRLTTREDSSNQDPTFFRNRLRHEVLPYLARINPRIAARLCALAEVVRADYELLESLAQQAWDSLLLPGEADNTLSFDLIGFRALPLALQRALIRRAAYHLRPTLRDVDFTHVEAALHIATNGITGQQATLPRGLLLCVEYERLVFREAGAPRPPASRPWLEAGRQLELSVPGRFILPNAWVLTLEPLATWDRADISANPDAFTAYLDADALRPPLILRTRQPGDRFWPLGLAADTNLGDFLVKAKIPTSWRPTLPLLCSGATILWIPGVRLSEQARVTPTTCHVVKCTLYPMSNAEETAWPNT